MTLTTAVVYGIDPPVFYRLINTESNFRSFAVSPQDAIGLGQVKESTARYIHVKHRKGMLFVPFYNLKLSAKYIHYLQGRFEGNWTLVLAAYNCGENNVEQRIGKRGIDPKKDYRHLFADIPETSRFLDKVFPAAKNP
jgi:soluble lytic murein transglycosylase